MKMIIKISISKNEGKAMIKEVKEIPIVSRFDTDSITTLSDQILCYVTLGKVLKKLQCEKELIELLSPEKFKRTRYEFFIIKFMSDYYLECGKIKSSLRVFDKINERSSILRPHKSQKLKFT